MHQNVLGDTSTRDTWYDLTCFNQASEHIERSPFNFCHLAYKPQTSAPFPLRTIYINIEKYHKHCEWSLLITKCLKLR